MRARPFLIAGATVLAALALTAGWLFGAFQPDIGAAPAGGPALTLIEVASGFEQPVQIVEGPDGFAVVQQGGLLVGLNHEVLVDLSSQVSRGYEQGLLSAVWHDGWYTHHTNKAGDTVLSYWNGANQTILWTHPQPYANHNGGMLAIGPDGMLWMALGDGGLAADPGRNGQDTDTHLGGILRFDVSVPGTIAVPDDNPFRDGEAPYLAHYGLRNPWRFSFDKATGDLWIGDVGQGNVEEINRAPADALGLNFGWSVWEGSNRFQPGSAAAHVKPVAEYDHDGGHCSVTGGYVIRDDSPLEGTYVFADFCSGQIWTHANGQTFRTLDTALAISSFGQDNQGRVYVVDLGGTISRITA